MMVVTKGWWRWWIWDGYREERMMIWTGSSTEQAVWPGCRFPKARL